MAKHAPIPSHHLPLPPPRELIDVATAVTDPAKGFAFLAGSLNSLTLLDTEIVAKDILQLVPGLTTLTALSEMVSREPSLE